MSEPGVQLNVPARRSRPRDSSDGSNAPARSAGPESSANTRSSPAAASRSDVAYRALKTHLLLGEFPLNVRLGEERIASMLKVSRTPVREALRRLHAEGLLERRVDGGFQPIVPDVTTMRHLYEVREGIELRALQRPARTGTRHDPALLEPLRDQWRQLAGAPPAPDPNFVMLDEAFHISLATAAGNRVAVEVLAQINDRIRLVRMLDFLSAERIEATIAEHLQLVESVLSGDLVGAEAVFTSHLAGSMAVVEERVQIAITRMVTGGQA